MLGRSKVPEKAEEEGEVFSLERRRRIYQFIRSHPGFHLRALERRLPISLGDLRYHLDYLEKRGLITTKDDGFRKTYFSSRDVYLLDRDVLALLRQRLPRRVILHLLLVPSATFEELRAPLDVSKSTLSFHLKKLTKRKVVHARRVEGRNEYFVEDRERVATLLITYKSSFMDTAVDRTLEVWLS